MRLSDSKIEFYQQNPTIWLKDFLDVDLWEKQIEAINNFVKYSRVTIRSGHGIGKTFLAACLVLSSVYTHPGSEIITTAPTNRQVEKILWKEIHKLHARLEQKTTRLGELLTKELRIEAGWGAIGFSTDDPNAFQGHHGEKLIAIFDEACGINPAIYESAEGILTAPGNKALLIGNPTEPNTYFHNTHNGKEVGYKRMRISCFDSPNITINENGEYVDKSPLPYPALTSMAWINRVRRSKGEGSNFWKSRVLGEFPETATDQLIDGKYIAKAMHSGIILRNLINRLQETGEVLSSKDIAKIQGNFGA